MPSSRHENTVSRIAKLIEPDRGIVLSNTDDGGKNGYRLPLILCTDGKERPFVVDCAVRTHQGAMLAFEVFVNHEVTAMKRRMLEQIGWTLIEHDAKSIDTWVQDPSLLDEEISYWIKKTNERLSRVRILAA